MRAAPYPWRMSERFAGLLHRAGALHVMMRLRTLAPVPTVSIVTYHHVAEHDPRYPYDTEVSDATPAQFRWQMETLARYCTPIGIDELLQALEGAPLPKNPVMVTFDDGYQSCHDVALPILRSVGIRATFFIATSFISERRLYWWERVSLLVGQGTKPGTITYPTPLELVPRSPVTRRLLNSTIKDAKHLDIERFLDEAAVALGTAWSPEIEAGYANHLIMTWDQVRALARAGMDVESHSRTHRVLQTLDDDALRSELARLARGPRGPARTPGARDRLSRRTPPRPQRPARPRCGHRRGLSGRPDQRQRGQPDLAAALRGMAPIDRFDVRRLALDRSMSDAMYLTQIALPGFAYIGRHEPD